MDAVEALADRHGLSIVEDAAHAPGAAYRGRMCGTLGSVGCFSFFANKNLPIGEGGMMLTDDDELAERLRLLRSHGMTTLTWDRHRGHASTYDVVLPGFNYRLDELRAAMGSSSSAVCPSENAGRARVVARYRRRWTAPGAHDAVRGRRGGRVPSHHLAVVLLPEGVDRDAVRAALDERGSRRASTTRRSIRSRAYRSRARRPLPQTDAVAERILTLPLYGRMTDEQVDTVIEALRQTL